MKYFIFLISTLVLTLCKKEVSTSSDNQFLKGCWMHDLESSANSENRVYKRCESKKWPAARFRHYIKIQDNGKYTELSLAPNDAHFEVSGKWNLEDKMLLLTNENKEVNISYEIVEMSNDVLVLKMK
jgi:hypothetical protein